MSLTNYLNLALQFHAKGDLSAAQKHYHAALKIDPNCVLALGWLGTIEAQNKNFSIAKTLLEKALHLEENNHSFMINYANLLQEIGSYAKAASIYEKCLSLGADVVGLTNLAECYNSLHKPNQALIWAEKALSMEPNYAEAWNKHGNALNNLRRLEEALASYDRAIELKPDYAEAWSNRGNALHDLKRHDAALVHYNQAISLKPDYAEAWFNKGVTLSDLKRHDAALVHYEQAISLKPDYAEAWSNRGVALSELKRYHDGLLHFDQAISLKPDYAEAWFNKGVTFNELKRYDEALVHYDQAISLKPDYAEAWFNKGVTFNELKHYDEALVHFDQALTLKPNMDWVTGDLLHLKMKICNWTNLIKSLDNLSKKVMIDEKAVQPFALLSLSDDALLHRKSSEIYVRCKYPFNNVLGPIPKRSKSDKIRVGYFSADFHNHATGYLMAELFELHDKSQFELIGFSFGPVIKDEMRNRLKISFNEFIEVGSKSNIEVAKLSRNLNVDIAVDLKGFTQDLRTEIFSYRAAPIQVNYLGYPGTMGADYMDYILADKTLISTESQACYSEKIVYLPNSYQSNDRKRVISERQLTRQELELPEKGFVYCCFNNNYKILPSTFDSWMRILKAVEEGILWLFEDNPWVVENLRKEADRQGIDAKRLIFAQRMPLSEHLARHRQADLFLDTLPYNAHTTCSDALWTGLPVLTLMGRSFASRVAASLLNAIGLPELITNTQEEYEALAIELAKNPQKLKEIKLRLANNRLTTPLFDSPLFTKSIEGAYTKMHERYQADLQPDHIII